MMNDPLAQVFTHIRNAEAVGKSEVTTEPVSKMITKVLEIMKSHEYILGFEIQTTNQGGLYKIQLPHKINGCGVIKPRFPVKKIEYLKWEKRYLPGEQFGILIVSTPKGLMTQQEAKEKGLGGKLIAFVY